jgi:hypothetical protein
MLSEKTVSEAKRLNPKSYCRDTSITEAIGRLLSSKPFIPRAGGTHSSMSTPTLMYGRKNQKGSTHHRGGHDCISRRCTRRVFLYRCRRHLHRILLYIVAGSLGIGMAYHRLLTHRGYKTHKWMEYFLTVCGTLALEGGPIFWVATHRIHHQKSDRDGDPHTPREGTWWAHMGWILTGDGLHHDASVLSRYAPDLCAIAFHVWLSNWHWLSNVDRRCRAARVRRHPYVSGASSSAPPSACTAPGW